MAGATAIVVKESLDERVQQLPQVEKPTDKERLQVLYWLKQEKPPSIGAIAKAIGKHCNTVGRWLLQYQESGINANAKSRLVVCERFRNGQKRHLPSDYRMRSMDLPVMA